MLFGSEWGVLEQAGAATAYLGQHDKLLIRRHREDDPPAALGSATDTNFDMLIK